MNQNTISALNDEILERSNFINEIDGISLYERLELVNSYISKNYSKYKELEGFLIFEKK